jgi:FtsH-binding integral membrane protein
MLAPLAIVFYMSFGIAKMSAAKAQTTFWIFAALMGASLSSIFLIYTGASITRVFFITCRNLWRNEYLRLYNKERFN